MGRPAGSKNKPKVTESAPSVVEKVENTQTYSSTTTNNKRTAAEMKEWYEKNKRAIENFANADEAVKKLKDATKDTRYKTISKIKKDDLLSWLQNPSSNEKNLRNLSQYLYYRSHLYYKIIKYHANMLECDIRSVIPKIDLTKENDPEKVKKSYFQTLEILDRMNLQSNFVRIASICYRDDVFFGCKYFDDKGHMFIMPLNPDYCKLNGYYETGDLAFMFDCSFLDKYPELLEYWGEPFTTIHSKYQSEKQKWQQFPDEFSAAFKFRYEDLDLCIPPFSGIMNSLLSLLSLEDLQDVVDEQQIYKLLVAQVPLLSGTNIPDDFAVDLATAVQYFNRMIDALPNYLGAVLSPIPIEQISFEDNTTSEINRVDKATQSILETAGGAQVLGANVSGSTAVNAALRLDSEFAISTLLPQIEGWINRHLSYELSNPSKVKMFNTTSYLKAELRKELLESAQYGLPTKLAVNTIHGFSEADTMALNFLEEQVLGVTDLFRPLQSSYTQSGTSSTGGAPTKDDATISDDGESSRDKRENAG